MQTYVIPIVLHTLFLEVDFVLVVQTCCKIGTRYYSYVQTNLDYTTRVTKVATGEAIVCRKTFRQNSVVVESCP